MESGEALVIPRLKNSQSLISLYWVWRHGTEDLSSTEGTHYIQNALLGALVSCKEPSNSSSLNFTFLLGRLDC